MADKAIGELPVADALYDDSLLVVEQQAQARSIRGELIRGFAQAAVEKDVQRAIDAADAAQKSEDAAAQSAADAAQSAGEAADSAQHAEQYSGKPPIIQNGTWWTWNADEQQYADTGETAWGNILYAAFWLDPTTGDLYMYTDDAYDGPDFRLAGNDLEVVLNAGSTP